MTTGRVDSDTLLLRVFREQRPWLWGFLTRHLGTETAAADVLDETFLDAWDMRADLGAALLRGDRDAVRRFLWRGARNRVIDETRADSRRRARTESIRPVGDTETEPTGPSAAAPGHAACLAAVRESVNRLHNRRLRQCLRRWLEGADLAALSRDYGLPIGELRAMLQRGRHEVLMRASHALQMGSPAGGRK